MCVVQLMLDLKPVKEIAYFNKITIDLPKPTAEVYTQNFFYYSMYTHNRNYNSLMTGALVEAAGHPGGEQRSCQLRSPSGGEERYLWPSGGGRAEPQGLEDLLL